MTHEAAYLFGLLFIGIVVLPIAVYQVGQFVFGGYDGAGYGDFYRTIAGKIRDGNLVAWFLVLSPYMVVQCLRLTVKSWRFSARAK